MAFDFSITRIILLIRKYIYENLYREIMFWCIVSISFMALDHRIFVLFVLFLSGLINGVHIYNYFLKKSNKMRFLMIPASQSEKILTIFALNTIYHFSMILIAYSVANLLVTFVYHYILKLQIPVNWDLFSVNNTIYINGYTQKIKQNVFFNIFGIFALCQSIFTFGFFYFNTNRFSKTVLSVITIGLGIMALQFGLFKYLWDVKHISNAVYPVIVMLTDSTVPAIVDNAFLIAYYIFFPILWIISYFKFSEKQI